MQGHRRVGFAVQAIASLPGAMLLVWASTADRSWFEHHRIWRFCANDCASMWRYCTTDCTELPLVDHVRWAAAGTGLVVLLAVGPLLGRWAARLSARSVVGLSTGLGGAALMALAVYDMALRQRPARSGSPPRLQVPPSRLDTRYGWVQVASRTSILQYGDKRVLYAVDAGGNRVASSETAVDRNAPTLLVTGESLALGFGVEYGESFPAMVADELHLQAINVSVTGYGNDQAYLRARDELARLAHPVAVVTLVVPVQLVRNRDERRPHLIPGEGGELHEVPALSGLWQGDPLRELWLGISRYHSGEAVKVAHAAFSATDREARAKGAVPLFVLAHWGPPCDPDENGTPWIERVLFGGLSVDHARVDVVPSYWDAAAEHPDWRAHRQLADAIVQRLRPSLHAALRTDPAIGRSSP
jgi:hypothetical protein